jgi:site-specific DNA recombinase
MRAALYIRVSTDEQAAEGFSIRAQKDLLVDYCRVNDYNITNIYIDDGYSAKDTKRPRLQELLKAAKDGAFDAVVVYKLDRFTRSVKDLYDLLEYLQTNGVGFISRQEKFDTTTAIGRALIGLIAVFAQFERELIAERVRMGVEQKVKEGKRPGGKYPYGYDRKGNSIPEEFDVLRKVKSYYMNGMSYQGVAARLYQEGIDRRGHEWTASTVALTLENPFYAGIIRLGSKMPNGKYAYRKRDEKVKVIDVMGQHEAVWSIEEYEQIIARMRRRSEGGYSKKTQYWFNGVLRCGRCGAAMYGRLTTSRKRKNGEIVRSAYYWCSRRKANKSCDMPMFRQTHVEHLIMEHIESIRTDQIAVAIEQDGMKKTDSERKKEVARLRKELEKIRARIKKWQYAFAEDIINEVDLKKRMDEEYEAENAILEKLEIIEVKENNKSSNRLFELVELWPTLDDLDKQEAIASIFERITLITDESNVKGVKNAFFPARAEVKYRQ